MSFDRIDPERKVGDEQFCIGDSSLDFGISHFWKWAVSDLVSNTQRGVLAEFLVASALGVANGVRSEWDAFDLTTASGLKVEVKSSGYLQAWWQAKLSTIQFGIAPKRIWNPDNGILDETPCRPADVYVFVVQVHKDQQTLDPMDLNQWEFYVLRRTVLDEKCEKRKSIVLSSLIRLGPKKVSFEELRDAVHDLDE